VAAAAQLGPALVHLREGNRGNAEQIAFHGRAHGARVNRVVAHVGAVVDARDHQIGPVAKQAGQRDMHAVCRRAVHVAKAVIGLVHIQRCIQRQGIGLGAVVVLGRHHFDVCHGAQRIVQGHDAWGLEAVVIANKNLHG
jgi:hypothetical protein